MEVKGRNFQSVVSDTLRGKPIHVYRDDEIDLQGIIVDKTKDVWIIRLFSFIDGRPTVVVAIPSDIVVTVYSNNLEMLRAYHAEQFSKGLTSNGFEVDLERNIAFTGLSEEELYKER